MIRSKPKAKIESRSAFSLTELVVVLGVIAILIALLLPALFRARSRAQQIQCVSNLHQLGIGLNTFLANNHGYPIFAAGTNEGYPARDKFWFGQLERVGLGIAKPETNYYQKGVWLCPTAKSAHPSQITDRTQVAYYGYNNDLWYRNHDPANPNLLGLEGHYDPMTRTFQPIAESEVAAPSDMMAIGDSFELNTVFNRQSVAVFEQLGNILTRHQDNGNVAFCDGHVESPTVNFLFDDTSDTALRRWNRDDLPHRERLAP